MTNFYFQKKNIFCFIIILFCINIKLLSVVYAKESVLLIRPLGKNYSKIEREFQKKVGSLFNIENLPVNKYLNSSDIAQKESQINPRVVILIAINALSAYEKYKNDSLTSKSRPVIILLPKLLTSNERYNLINSKNSITIEYFVSIPASVKKLEEKFQKKIKKIGVIYHRRMKNEMMRSMTYSHKNNVYTQSYEVTGTGEKLQIELKKRFSEIEAKNIIDVIMVPNDPQLTTPELIKNLWKPFFDKTKIMSIVLNESLLGSKGGFGTMYIRPDYNEIGELTGDLVKDIIVNNTPLTKLETDSDRFFYCSFGSLPVPAKQMPDTLVTVAASHEENNLLDTTTKNTKKDDAGDRNNEKTLEETVVNTVQDPEKKKLLVAFSNEKNDKKPVPDNIKIPKEKKNQQSMANKKPGTEKKSLVDSDRAKKQEKKEVDTAVQDVEIDKSELVKIIDTSKVSTKIVDSIKVAEQDNTGFFTRVTSIIIKLSKPQLEQFSARISPYSKSILLFGVIAIVLIIPLLIFIRFLRKKNFTKTPSGNSCMIVSRKLDKIRYSGKNDFSIPLHKFFKKLKFEVTVAKDLKPAKETLMRYVPNVICVDWQFDVDIRSDLQKMLPDISLLSDVIIIFYNAIDSFHFENEAKFARTYYLGTSFTLKEIKEIINPLLNGKKKIQQDTIKDNYLAGKISNYNLVEIFQLLGSEKKNGCLIIECDVPVGLIFFNNSRIIYAITNDLKGKEAVFKILKLKEGMFRFVPEKKPISTNMDHDIFHVLMEWTASMDKETQKKSSPQKK